MILKHRDRTLLRFDWLENGEGVRISSLNDENRQFLPLDFRGEPTDENLWKWLCRRVVPRNRQYVFNFLLKVGLNPRDIRGIITLCRGLSLNDVHWVVPDDFKGSWAECNLYDNEFSKTMAFMAFTGGGDYISPAWTSSPEFTTNGMLAKCWRRIDNQIVLFKGGTEGAANTGFEPYSEYLAAQVAEALGLPHVDYGLEKFKGRLCSTCPLFTSDRYGFISAGRLLHMEEALNDPRFADIFFFDAITFNTDRHLGNFGYLIDNDTNEIIGAAPIFDNGYGLFSLAVYQNRHLNEFDDLSKFLKRVRPALYDEWLGFPHGLTAEMKARLKNLHGFRFKRHPYYNLPVDRVRSIEKYLQNRISKIDEFGERADEIMGLSPKCFTEVRVNEVLSEAEGLQKIKSNIHADPFITQTELADLLRVSRTTVAAWLKKLKSSGEIRRNGSPRAGYWELCSR